MSITISTTPSTAPAFSCGQLFTTAKVSELSAVCSDFSRFVNQCFTRHQQCDWGDCVPQDRTQNNHALQHGGRLFSVYHFPTELHFVHRDKKLWIITEANRSTTTILFPSEY